MKKTKKYKHLFLLFLGCLCLSGVSIAAGSNKPFKEGSMSSLTDTSGLIHITESEGTILFSEDQDYAYYLNTASLAVSILDKNTQYLWRSDRDLENEDSINQLWTHRIMSGVTLDYYDKKLKKSGYATITGDNRSISLYQGDDFILAEVTFIDLSISFTLKLTVKDNKLTAEVPFEGLKEDTGAVITAITIFPFLGSTYKTDTEGYIIVPEGSGVIMEYGRQKTAINGPYKAKVYGGDAGLLDMMGSSYTLTLPMYGIVNGVNQNSFYTHIRSGSAYASLSVYPSGVTTGYNWASFTYSYRQNFFHPTGSDGGGYIDLESNMNAYDIKTDYIFINNDDANYTGIAKDYQNMLINQGTLTKNTSSSFLHLEFFGAEIFKTMLGFQTKVYTTVDDVREIVEDLSEYGISPVITYSGTSKNGRSGNMPNVFPLESKLGSEKDFKELFTDLKGMNIPAYLTVNYMYARSDKGGFNKKKDQLRRIDQRLEVHTEGYENYTLSIGMLSFHKTKRLFDKDLKDYKKNNMDIAVEYTGSKLYSDYGTYAMNREESLSYVSEIFLRDDIKTAFYEPNEYVWACMDRYFSIPMSGSGYLHFSKDIPFLQIVLKGYVDYYSPWQNTSPNPREDLLRMIEYGIYPTFIVTKQAPYDLVNTPYSYIFSSEYALWRDKIIEMEKIIRDVSSVLTDACIINHNNDGTLGITTYDNGIIVYVNYSENEVSVDGLSIAPESYYIKGR